MSSFPIRVLHIASWYPSRLHRTLGNFIARHVEAVNTRCPSTVLALYSDPDSRQIKLERGIESKVDVLRVYHPTSLKYKQRYKAFKQAIELLKTDGQLPFDVVHLHVMFPHGWMALRLLRDYGIPYIVTEHWSIYQHPGRMSGLQRVLDRRVAAKAAQLCPVSAHLGRAMRAAGLAGKYHPIPNVVDTARFARPVPGQSVFNFLHVSSLVDEVKNLSGILRAFARLKKQAPSARLHIIGDGDTSYLHQLADELGLNANKDLVIEAEKSLDEIAQAMAECQCLVQFSNYENLPCVIIEALASGRPVISSDVGGISEYLSPELGVLIPAKDEDALVSAMNSMLIGHEAYEPEKLQAFAASHFGIEPIAKQFEQLYRSVLLEKAS